jgi:hypothetical protein
METTPTQSEIDELVKKLEGFPTLSDHERAIIRYMREVATAPLVKQLLVVERVPARISLPNVKEAFRVAFNAGLKRKPRLMSGPK